MCVVRFEGIPKGFLVPRCSYVQRKAPKDRQETCPAYSIGTSGYTGNGYREVQGMKVFLSRKLTQRIQQGRTAPGRVYLGLYGSN